MKINSNIQAMIAGNVLKNNEMKLSTSTEKMSSGYKINNAKDNPSGMAISNRMRAQLQSLNKARQNASNAVNVVETADGTLAEVQDMLHRLKELSVKSANDINTTEDRVAIQDEVEQLMEEIESIYSDTEYNTQSLLNGEQRLKGYSDVIGVNVADYNSLFPTGKDYSISFDIDDDGNVTVNSTTGFENDALIEADGNTVKVTNRNGGELLLRMNKDELATGSYDAKLDINGIGGMKIQTGSAEGQEIQLVIPEISTENMGIKGIDVRTEAGAKAAMENVDGALDFVSRVRSRLGAYQNRFETTVSNLDATTENLTRSYSTIKDIDMADEMVNYTTLQVLTQAGTSMLSQANEQPQQALQLLQ